MEKTNHKKLHKSNQNRVMTGVIGGLAEYINLDPLMLRAFFLAITAVSGIFPGVAAYLFLALILPERPL